MRFSIRSVMIFTAIAALNFVVYRLLFVDRIFPLDMPYFLGFAACPMWNLIIICCCFSKSRIFALALTIADVLYVCVLFNKISLVLNFARWLHQTIGTPPGYASALSVTFALISIQVFLALILVMVISAFWCKKRVTVSDDEFVPLIAKLG